LGTVEAGVGQDRIERRREVGNGRVLGQRDRACGRRAGGEHGQGQQTGCGGADEEASMHPRMLSRK
jgi:hypothetical protein